ncbi:MAG: hypothetical protein R3C04_04385 [Hyphomonas sp.]
MKSAACLSVLALALLAGCSKPATPAAGTDAAPAEAAAPAPVDALQAAIDSDLRSPAEKARDAWRHPKETLEFFGATPDKTVVEIWPGGGWYTNILAPWMATGNGKLVLAIFDPAAQSDEEGRARTEANNEEFKANYADPKFGTIDYTVFSRVSGPLMEPDSADIVLTFRNIQLDGSRVRTKILQRRHAAPAGGARRGRTPPAFHRHVIRLPAPAMSTKTMSALAANAGFEFAGSSEINANPADTADHLYGGPAAGPQQRSR